MAIVLAVAVVQVGLLLADGLFGIDHYDLVRDPNAIAGQPNYFGAVSNLGIVLWMISAATALQAFLVRVDERQSHLGGALLWGGIFTGLMGLDDLFMIHESIATLGIPELVVMIPHGLAMLMLLHHAARITATSRWPLLVAAVAGFALSMGVDIYPIAFDGQVFVEEGFKLLGISFLAAYLQCLAHSALAHQPH